MPLPSIEFFEAALDYTMEDFLYKLQHEDQSIPNIPKRTFKNWRDGKSKIRESTVRRFFDKIEKLSEQVFPDGLESVDTLLASNPGPQNIYSLKWRSYLNGVEAALGSDACWTIEARRLLEVSLKLKEACSGGNAGRVANVIETAGLPKTRTCDETIKFLRMIENKNQSPDDRSMVPLYLETTLYLIACYDQDKGFRLLHGLCHQTDKDTTVAPMSRVLDKFREKLDISTDQELGMRLLPGQDPESARNEVRKWRSGKRKPSWKRIGQWSRDIEGPDSNDIIWTIAFARVIEFVAECARSIEPQIEWFETKILFQNLDLLNEHAAARAYSSSQSSGRSSSPRDCQ